MRSLAKCVKRVWKWFEEKTKGATAVTGPVNQSSTVVSNLHQGENSVTQLMVAAAQSRLPSPRDQAADTQSSAGSARS